MDEYWYGRKVEPVRNLHSFTGINALPVNSKSLEYLLGSRISDFLSNEHKIADFGPSKAKIWPLLDVRLV